VVHWCMQPQMHTDTQHIAYSGLACVSVERASRARANVEHKEFVTYRGNLTILSSVLISLLNQIKCPY
jgi:hypothetical protein